MIYLIVADNGMEYSDFDSWNVCYFLTEPEAQAFLVKNNEQLSLMNAWDGKYEAECDAWRNNNPAPVDPPKPVNSQATDRKTQMENRVRNEEWNNICRTNHSERSSQFGAFRVKLLLKLGDRPVYHTNAKIEVIEHGSKLGEFEDMILRS